MYILYKNNPIKVPTFFLDNSLSLFNRIANMLNTLPEFLYIPNKERLTNEETKETFIPLDLWSVARKNKNIMDIINMLGEQFEIETIITLWAMYHKTEFNLILMNSEFVEKYSDIIYTINNIDRAKYFENLQEKHQKFKKEQEDITTMFKNLTNTETTPVSEFDKEHITKRVAFTSSKNTLYSIFDNLRTSAKIPLITYNNYYKILKHYTPPLNWKSSDEQIICKLLIEEKTYNDIIITQGDGNTYHLELMTSIFYNIDDIITNVLDSIPNINVIDTTFTNVGGFFSYDGIIDNNIFADILLTTNYIPKFITVNDNIKHVGEFGNRHLYFKNPYSESKGIDIKAMITRKVASMNDILPVNTVYTNIKILKGLDNETIAMFRTLFGKLITLYNERYNEIKAFYSAYNIVKDSVVSKRGRKRSMKQKVGTAKKFPKDIVPEIFKAEDENYTRICQKSKQPTIIEYDEVEDEKLQVMQFPKESDSHISQPRYYICTNPDYPYPGLTKFGNALGVAPCCYKDDQRQKYIYRTYFEEIEIERRQTVSYFKKTNKIIEYGNFGYFPDRDRIINNIGLIFEKFDTPQRVILRQGVNHYPNSFLDCVLTALKHPSISDTTGQERQDLLKVQRRNLTNRVSASVAMQEMYGESLLNIEEYIQRVDEYLDPEKVIRLVERVYDCNILLFVKNDMYPTGELIVPRHISGYCRFVRDDSKPSVFIFNHLGSETDKLSYPHCELIIQTTLEMSEELKKNVHFASQMDSTWGYKDGANPIYNFCWKLYDKLATYYYKQVLVVPTPLDLVSILNIQEQYVDENGKVRLLLVSFSGYDIVLETSPLPPFDMPLMTIHKPKPTERRIIVQFMEQHRIRSPVEYVIPDLDGIAHSQYIKGWYYDLFTIKIYIESENQFFLPQGESFQMEYNNNSKISRYITNWSMYLFSKFINSENIQEIDKSVVQQFANTFFTINTGYKYDPSKVGDSFNIEDASGILEGGRIVCTSEELLKRVIYQLRILIERDRSSIANYQSRTSMDSYYISENDFTTYNNEIVIYYSQTTSPITLSKLLTTQTEYRLNTYPPNITTPYFFDIGQIVLAQNSNTVDKALSTSIVWNERGYNAHDEDIIIREDVPFYLYLQNKAGKKQVYQVGEGIVENNTSILATSDTFVSLMSL